ncbi:putative inorganic carbon transporter subunit DabA OS=Castellaniella defragrans (strain DSM/ CCUG 39792 / 65Phen) OX=1437824 GN=dabA PE=3 SV=1 [Castellaniella denitrificans]
MSAVLPAADEAIAMAAPFDGAALRDAVARACSGIMPAWPLDQAVAVNPHWRRVGMPIRRVAARLAVLGDFRVFPSRDYIRREWDAGQITRAALDAALKIRAERDGRAVAAERCIAGLEAAPRVRRAPLLVDLLDDAVQKNRRWPWRDAIVFQMSQACATYFDRHQADWRASGSPDLYGFWRESMAGDHGLSARLGLPGLMRHVRRLPLRADDAISWALAELGLEAPVWRDYFEALLLSINGWASWCAYVGWQKVPAGQDDARLSDLLACRIAWEAVLACAAPPAARGPAAAALAAAWLDFPRRVAEADAELEVDELWQEALEIGFQRDFARTLRTPAPADAAEAPEVQAVFCIDTRSERMRRALEALWPGVQTRACAGFFGIPAHYAPLGTDVRRPQLPGPAYPTVAVRDVATAPGQVAADGARSTRIRAARRRRLARLDQGLGAVRWPNATFSFVETLGVAYLGKIAHWIRPPAAPRAAMERLGMPAAVEERCRPMVVGLDVERRAELAADVLRTMGLGDRLAPLVILCGHAGHSTNNAHASTLDCGACHGRSGEANARALAHLLNDPRVRAGLRSRGLDIPPGTVFMGALHNTTTDEVTGFDLDLLPPAARARWDRMKRVFAQAGDRVRRERAPALWMDAGLAPEALLTAFRRRANDGSQTRPEWGLTRNAAFIIGPRGRSRGRVLDRVYLHDYDARSDTDGTVLEALMTGPMVVTHWLSWQYHASTCDPVHYGSGNKVLHNVVDGHVGVFEGNGGDLRIGLPRQSLHDGDGWYHQPVRLTVVIDAPAASIEGVIARHAVLGQLCDNGWMLLWRYEGDDLRRYERGRWLPLEV